MNEIYRIISYIVDEIIANTNVPLFLSTLFLAEAIKSLTLRHKDGSTSFRFDKTARFRFQYRYFVFVLGVLLAVGMWWLQDPETRQIRAYIISAGITYAMTTTFYELISAILFRKLREVLWKVKTAKVKDVEIDPAAMMGLGGDSYGYNYESDSEVTHYPDDVLDASDDADDTSRSRVTPGE